MREQVVQAMETAERITRQFHADGSEDFCFTAGEHYRLKMAREVLVRRSVRQARKRRATTTEGT